MLKLLKRTATTAVKLPFDMAWDVISLGNMGDEASTSKVLREHEQRKQVDDSLEVLEAVREIKKEGGK
ncbi:MAG: hypothetical protein ACRECD_13925 [Burkholderiaceae bacterium]